MLLILAGVTIVTLTGDNGILTKATEAKDKTEEGEEEEKVKLSVAGALAKDNGGEIKEGYLDEELASQFGEKVRNLTIEDIEEQMNETGKTVRNNYKNNSSGTQYGSIKTYNGQNKYPNLYALENGSGIDTEKVKDNGIGVSEEYYKEPTEEKSEITSSELTVTQTYYRMNFQRDYLKKPEVYDMIFEGCYWLASRYVDCNEDGAYFGLYWKF